MTDAIMQAFLEVERAMQKFNDSLVRLRSWCSSLPSDEWVLGRPSRRRYSRYGPWFPAETW